MQESLLQDKMSTKNVYYFKIQLNEITGRSVFARCIKDSDTVSGSENTRVVDQAFAGEELVLPCKVFLWSTGLHLWPLLEAEQSG